MSNKEWIDANSAESDYWEIFTCELETFKHQETYIDVMGIRNDYFHAPDNSLNLSGLNVLDVGGGPSSILLRTNNLKGNQHEGVKTGVVIDPLRIIDYHKIRYDYYGIKFINDQAENIDLYYNEMGYFDECFIYNCLQHTLDPIKILDKVSLLSKRIRIAEPINVPVDNMHLHMFTEKYFEQYFSKKQFKCNDSEIVRIGGADHYVGLFSVEFE